MTTLVNLTPHEVKIVTAYGTAVFPSRGIARVSVSREEVDSIPLFPGTVYVPVYRSTYGAVEGLPEPKEGMMYIVSRMVAEACRTRDDLYIPDDLIRDKEGRVTGARAFARV